MSPAVQGYKGRGSSLGLVVPLQPLRWLPGGTEGRIMGLLLD